MKRTFSSQLLLLFAVMAAPAIGNLRADTNALWWSLRPIHRPPIPKTEVSSSANPVDRFLYAKLREQNLDARLMQTGAL